MSDLYRQIDDNTFVKYDSLRDTYECVPANRVPSLVPVAQRTRLSQKERSDPTAAFRRVALLAMLDVTEPAIIASEPARVVPHLAGLAKIATDPAAQRRLRLPGVPVPSSDTVTLPASVRDTSQHTGQEILRRVAHGAPSQHDLEDMVYLLPAVSVAEIRRARVTLDAAWGTRQLRSAGVIDTLVKHVREQVDASPARLSLNSGVQLCAPAKPSRTYRRL